MSQTDEFAASSLIVRQAASFAVVPCKVRQAFGEMFI